MLTSWNERIRKSSLAFGLLSSQPGSSFQIFTFDRKREKAKSSLLEDSSALLFFFRKEKSLLWCWERKPREREWEGSVRDRVVEEQRILRKQSLRSWGAGRWGCWRSFIGIVIVWVRNSTFKERHKSRHSAVMAFPLRIGSPPQSDL